MLLRTWFHHVSHKWRASSRNFEPGLFQSCANSKEGNHIDIARAQTSNSKGFSDVSFLPLHARNGILLQNIPPNLDRTLHNTLPTLPAAPWTATWTAPCPEQHVGYCITLDRTTWLAWQEGLPLDAPWPVQARSHSIIWPKFDQQT
jgi:hypothetical protein